MKTNSLNVTTYAQRALMDEVSAVMKKTGWDYHSAFMSVKKTRRDLFQAVNEESKAAASQPKATAPASVLPESQQLISAVNEIMGQRRCTWEDAWKSLKQFRPELLAAAQRANEARNKQIRAVNEAAFRNK